MEEGTQTMDPVDNAAPRLLADTQPAAAYHGRKVKSKKEKKSVPQIEYEDIGPTPLAVELAYIYGGKTRWVIYRFPKRVGVK